MALILCIETSTTVCSVALARDGRVLVARREDLPNSHSTRLTVLIEELMLEAGLMMDELAAVAVSSGPGSYTGLRIGVSVAKGLCFALQKPLLAFSSLEVLAAAFLQSGNAPEDGALLCPLMDARRMEVYTAFFNSDMQMQGDIRAEIVSGESFAAALQQGPVYFFGDGSDKCRVVLTHPNTRFVDEVVPLAAAMAPLAQERLSRKQFEDVAYFEPFYLKTFQATLPRNKVF